MLTIITQYKKDESGQWIITASTREGIVAQARAYSFIIAQNAFNALLEDYLRKAITQ